MEDRRDPRQLVASLCMILLADIALASGYFEALVRPNPNAA